MDTFVCFWPFAVCGCCQLRWRQEAWLEREGNNMQHRPPQPQSNLGCSSHMVCFFTAWAPGRPWISPSKFHGVVRALSNFERHKSTKHSRSSVSRAGGILSDTVAAQQVYGWTLVGPNDSRAKCFSLYLLAGGSWAGIQVELQIQSDKPQPLSVKPVL